MNQLRTAYLDRIDEPGSASRSRLQQALVNPAIVVLACVLFVVHVFALLARSAVSGWKMLFGRRSG